jgi:hypothetical protein
MNLSVLPASCRQKELGLGDETSAARCWGASLCAPILPTTLSRSAKDGAHGVTRPTSASWIRQTKGGTQFEEF